MNNNLSTVFVLMPILVENNYPYRACIVSTDPKTSKHTFVRWIKPVTYHHALPEFLREEFTRGNGKLLKPNKINGLPESVLRTPEVKKEISK